MFQPNPNHSNEEYIVVQKEKSFRFSRDVLGKPVIDKFGFKIGRVNDASISVLYKETQLDANPLFPSITGILVGKKFVPWGNVKKIGSHFVLRESLRRDDICPIPKDHTFLAKKILDEQLIDGHGRYVGRVDDIRLNYNIDDHQLYAAGLYSGALSILMRIGVDVFGNVIPWHCIEKIRSEKPTGIVLNFQRKTLPVSEKYTLYGVRKV